MCLARCCAASAVAALGPQLPVPAPWPVPGAESDQNSVLRMDQGLDAILRLVAEARGWDLRRVGQWLPEVLGVLQEALG